jgi:hypothetical protein
MLGLRLAEGLSLQTLCDRFGSTVLMTLAETLQPYLKSGWIELKYPADIPAHDVSANVPADMETNAGPADIVTTRNATTADFAPVSHLATPASWTVLDLANAQTVLTDLACQASYPLKAMPHLRLSLTDPEGFLFSNVILAHLFRIFDSD